MTEIILSLAALLLGLFCLICTARRRRAPHSPPLPGGLWGALKRRQGAYTALLGAFVIDATFSSRRRRGGYGGFPRALSASWAGSTSRFSSSC